MAGTEFNALRAKRFSSFRCILALILREMSSTYGRSPGGYVWAVLEPVAAIAMLSFAFQLVFRQPALGTNFPLYFATGFLPFSLTLETWNKVAASIRFSRSLLVYPALRYTDAIFARVILNTMTHLLIISLVLTGIHIVFSLKGIIDPWPVFLSLTMAVTLGLSVGTMNCYLGYAFPMWERVWAIVTRPLLLVSGVIFHYDNMPDRLREWLWYNPLVHVVGAMRKGFYATYDAPHVTPSYVFGVSLALAALGFLLLQRHNKAMINI